MSGNKALLDSNVVIYLSKGAIDAVKLLNGYSTIYISRITYMEVLGFNFQDQQELATVQVLFDSFYIYELNDKIADAAIEVRRESRLKLPDAIIYATALVEHCDLITADKKDFAKPDRSVRVVSPFS